MKLNDTRLVLLAAAAQRDGPLLLRVDGLTDGAPVKGPPG